MKYIQFFTKSTGYISGTIPPQFSDNNIKPIELLGSDGIFYLDGRCSLQSCINVGYNILPRKRIAIGFKIIQAQSLSDSGRILFTSNMKF